MRAISLLATAFIVFGCCNQALAQNRGRWHIAPIPGPPMEVHGTPHYFAWKIDTVTGAVQVCAYDPGGWKRPNTPGGVGQETLECFPSKSPSDAGNPSKTD